MPIKAVIFDMDGVIVDSMGYHVRAWQDTFKDLGLEISSQEVYLREGESWKKSTRDFLKAAGYKPDPHLVDKVFKKRSSIFKDIFRTKIFSGAKGLMVFLKKNNIRLGLVTATPQKDVLSMLPESIIELFDIMVCGGDTKRGKPHPDPYKKALRRLKLSPHESIVIENAPYGISSCRAAGMRCIAVCTSLPRKWLGQAHVVVDSLTDVKGYFSGILSGTQI